MSDIQSKGRKLSLHASHAVQLFAGLLGLLVTGGVALMAFLIFLFPMLAPAWVGSPAPEEFVVAWLISGGMAAWGTSLLIPILRSAPLFYVEEGRRDIHFPKFDSAKILRIGPLTGLDDKLLVVRLKWRPLPEHMPSLESLYYLVLTSTEPAAIFNVRLSAMHPSGATVLARTSVLQRVNLRPPGFRHNQYARLGKPPEEWQEIAIPVPTVDAPCCLEVNLSAHSPSDATPIVRLWVDVFVGYRLGDLKKPLSCEDNVADVSVEIV